MIQTLLTFAALASTCLTLVLLSLPSPYIPSGTGRDSRVADAKAVSKTRDEPIEVQILVLGDIGRSPRMQYHALSIAERGGHIQVVGYRETDVHPNLLSNPHVTIIPLHTPPKSWQTTNKLLFLLYGPLKVLFQVWSLWMVLGYRTKAAKWMLVQNPPSIPTLALAQILCFLRNTRLIIDWHNFGYTILALKLGSSHPLVKLSRWYESVYAHCATVHLAVTNAMAITLENSFRIRVPIIPLHDRPASHFQPMNSNSRSAFLSGLAETAREAESIRFGRTRLLVSSTSWTTDEDFSLLLQALVTYSALATTTHPQLPEILAIITGKGPQKDFYLQQIDALNKADKLEMVTIKTAWLSIRDYAALLASADLGVSLHTSSSGVDLPMKVVDMFGAGLPVVGWDQYEAWPELVKDRSNGRGFSTAGGLTEVLVELFGDRDNTELNKLRAGAMKEGEKRWDDEWGPRMGKLLGLEE